MLFTPITKRKKGSIPSDEVVPFPQSTKEDKKFTGVFTGFSVEVYQPSEICAIYDAGCFGKGSKSRGVPKVLMQKPNECVESTNSRFNVQEKTLESLVLDLEEAFLLAFYIESLNIVDLENKLMEWKDVFCEFQKIKPDFVNCFTAYLYLKAKNWVVKSGTKFGGNFLIYKKGLRYFHASFVVYVECAKIGEEPSRFAKDIKGLQRVAETSDKDVLFLDITWPADASFIIESLKDFNRLTVSENIIRRFNYSAFVQSKAK